MIQNIHNNPPKKENDTAVFDTGATSSCGRTGDTFIPTNEPSGKVLHMPTGETADADKKAKLHHKVREPARTVDMVPDLKHNSLISGAKFAEANYVTVLTPDELLIYDGDELHMTVNKEAVLRGWREQKRGGLWRVPLTTIVPPQKAEYLLLSREIEESIQNVYDLPSTKEIIRYLHACAGYPTKTTWLKAIRAGNYATWPYLSAAAVQKHFPESDETQQGHMRNIKQGIRSTKQITSYI